MRRMFILITILLASLAPSVASAKIQNIRLSPGKYAVSQKGALVPGRCINPTALPPTREHKFSGTSSSLFVNRIERGKVVDRKAFSEVNGKWLEAIGAGDGGVHFRPVDSTATYELDIPKTGPTIVGPTQVDVDRDEKSLTKTGAIEAITKLNTYESQLSDALGDNSRIVQLFRQEKVEIDWSWFSDDVTPDRAFDRFIRKFQSKSRGLAGTNPQQNLLRLTVAHGDILSAKQIEAIRTITSIPLSDTIPPSAVPHIREYATRVAQLENLCGESARGIVTTYRHEFEHYATSFDALPIALAKAGHTVFFGSEKLASPADHISVGLGRTLTVSEASLLSQIKGVNLGEVTGRLDNVLFVDEYPDVIECQLGASARQRLGSEEALELIKSHKSAIVIRGAGKKLDALKAAEPSRFIDYSTFVSRERAASFRIAKINGDQVCVLDRRRPDKSLEIGYVRFERPSEKPGIGDSIYLQLSNRSFVVVDTGLTMRDVAELKRRLIDVSGLKEGEQIRVQLILTHEDADHIGGARELLSDERFVIDEVIFGVSDARSKGFIGLLESVLKAPRYFDTPIKDASFLRHFVRKDVSTKVISTETIGDGKFQRVIIKSTDGVEMQVLQFVDSEVASTSNRRALVTRVRHNGVDHLLTSDIDPMVIRSLVKEQESLRASGFDLRCDILKWPHHISFPNQENGSFRNTMKEFLQAVNPHTITFSNRGALQTREHFDAAKALIEESLGKDVHIIWTEDDGSARFQTLIEKREELRFVSQHNDQEMYVVFRKHGVTERSEFRNVTSSSRRTCGLAYLVPLINAASI